MMIARMKVFAVSLVLGMCAAAAPAMAFVQYPNDIDNDPVGWSTGGVKGLEDIDWNNDGVYDVVNANAHLIVLGATDGFTKMADGYPQYMFGFMNLTGVPENLWAETGMNKSEFPAPTIDIREGEEVYLTLANLGLPMRPDLFDPHSVHFHGFINASAVFDGEPMSAIAVKMNAALSYYYKPVDPGTYIYHCHVEATEHIEMGMVANLLVRPKQDILANRPGACTDGSDPASFRGFVYNDADCSTGYDVEKSILLTDIDPAFHDLHIGVQPLPFALLEPKYFTMNGRGYPDTVNPAPIMNDAAAQGGFGDYTAQKLNSLIEATPGQRILIRLASLSVQNFVNVEILGLPVKVVGKDAKHLRKANGIDLTYFTNSVNVGPGETFDLLIDTTNVAPGTYYVYSRNLNQLNNDQMDRGGAMTEIRIQ